MKYFSYNPTHYIYILTDPRTLKPFYVGITQSPKERMGSHVTNSKKNKKVHTLTEQRIAEILADGQRPFMTIIDEIQTGDYVKSHELEASWISKMAELGHVLTNTRTKPITRRSKPSFTIVGIDDKGEFVIIPNN